MGFFRKHKKEKKVEMNDIRLINAGYGAVISAFNTEASDEEVDEFMNMTFTDLMAEIPDEFTKIPLRDIFRFINAGQEEDIETIKELIKKYNLEEYMEEE